MVCGGCPFSVAKFGSFWEGCQCYFQAVIPAMIRRFFGSPTSVSRSLVVGDASLILLQTHVVNELGWSHTCFQWNVLTHPSIDLSWSANGSNMAKKTWFGNDLAKQWWSDVKCNKYQQLPAKTCSSWWLISATKQSVTQIACDGSTYTKNQIEMPS